MDAKQQFLEIYKTNIKRDERTDDDFSFAGSAVGAASASVSDLAALACCFVCFG